MGDRQLVASAPVEWHRWQPALNPKRDVCGWGEEEGVGMAVATFRRQVLKGEDAVLMVHL